MRAPYGMTECLPVIDGVEPEAVGLLGGTATGRPLPGCEVVITPLDRPDGEPLGEDSWGEILVSAPWMFEGYEGRWSESSSSELLRGSTRFHRTGDVGYLSSGQLFQLGRASHVIRTASGPVPCVSIEERVALTIGEQVAAVGVGPAGASVLAVVVDASSSLRLAPPELAAEVRSASDRPLAAVLTGTLPTDRRHQSKIDRAALASSVATLLAGR